MSKTLRFVTERKNRLQTFIRDYEKQRHTAVVRRNKQFAESALPSVAGASSSVSLVATLQKYGGRR